MKNAPQSHLATELRVVGRDGSVRWVQRNAIVVPGAHGSDDVIIGQFQDITDRKAAEAELARLAVTDPLTGLLNRQAFHDAGDALGRAATPVGIVFIDLDGSSGSTTSAGMPAAMRCWARSPSASKPAVPEPDSAYRIGGDEFVAVVVGPGADDRVAELASRVRMR